MKLEKIPNIINMKDLKARTPSGRKLKRRIKGGLAAGAVSAGLLLSGLFGSPEELLNSKEDHITNPAAAMEMVDIEELEQEESEEENKEKTRAKRGISARIRDWILRLPIAVRALVGVPLWAIGWLLTGLLNPVWQQIGGFLLPVLIKIAILLVVLFLIIFLTVKALHPDLPARKILKKILRKKNILFLVIGAVVLGVLDSVLLLTLEDYEIWRRLIIFLVGLALLFLILRPFIMKAIKKKKEQNEQGALAAVYAGAEKAVQSVYKEKGKK